MPEKRPQTDYAFGVNSSGKEASFQTSSPPTVGNDVHQKISKNVTISHQDGSMLGVAYHRFL